MASRRPRSLSFVPELSLLGDGRTIVAPERFELLRKIQEAGSISAAAQALGVSYRTAWSAVEALNNLAGEPLIERTKGGSGGGGARLTATGERLLAAYEHLKTGQRAFLDWMSRGEFLAGAGRQLPDYLALLSRLELRTSARNQLAGRVERADPEGPRATLHVRLMNTQTLSVHVTRHSLDELGVRVGHVVVTLFKANAVRIVTPDMPVPARHNRLDGTLATIERDEQHSELSLSLPGGYTVYSLQPSDDASAQLAPGGPAIATFDPAVVLIAARG
ncbi:MAG: TOBE domain-containing protein [Polyangiaceae bacterium]